PPAPDGGPSAFGSTVAPPSRPLPVPVPGGGPSPFGSTVAPPSRPLLPPTVGGGPSVFGSTVAPASGVTSPLGSTAPLGTLIVMMAPPASGSSSRTGLAPGGEGGGSTPGAEPTRAPNPEGTQRPSRASTSRRLEREPFRDRRLSLRSSAANMCN